MKHLLVAAFGLFCLCAFTTSASAATTYYVAASNGNDNAAGTSANPFLTIHKASQVAIAGDTIIVRAGTYAGARFSTSGTTNSRITVMGEPGAIVQSPGPNNSNNDNLWIRNASYITITGFEVRSAGRAGIAIQAEPDAESHGVIIRNNYCHDNSRWGIFTAYAEGILIEGNETSFSAIEHGIYVSNSSDNPIIRRNRAHHNMDSGIQINADPALDGDGIVSNATIAYNVIWENGTGGGAAINLASVINSRITNNLLYDNHSTGIAGWDDDFDPDGGAFGTHDNTIAYNTIMQASNGRNAMSFIHGSSNNVIRNNVLIHPGSKSSIEVDTSSETGLASDYNIIINQFEVNGTFINATQWRARNHDQHSIVSTASAVFFDAAGHNYHAKLGSPAINAGLAVSGIGDDLDGKLRPQGGTPDIGAFEFRGVDSPGVFNLATAAWFLRNSNSPGTADVTLSFGAPGGSYVPLVGDWNGDGVDTIGLYDQTTGAFFLRNTNSGGAADLTFQFGPSGAGLVPITGDWNADGIDTIGLYNPTTGIFFLRNSNVGGAADVTFGFGPVGTGLTPIVGDWDGNGSDTIGLYGPSTSAFFLRNSNTSGSADVVFTYGPSFATPVVGDWNADAADTVGIYVASTGAWFLRNSNAPGNADLVFSYGPTGLKPTKGDWDAQ